MRHHIALGQGRGAYKLAGDNLELAGGLYAVQNQLKKRIHIGARTALEMKGYAHYLSPNFRKIFIFDQPLIWFREYNWSIDFYYTTSNLFPDILPSSFTKTEYKKSI
jgi:hypothetical protein